MTAAVGIEDEGFHAAGDDPHWLESAWFHLAVPERDLIGFVYFFHDVRTGTAGGGPAVWDPSGAEVYDCRFYDWRWLQPPTGPLDASDVQLPSGLRQRVLEPMAAYRITYDALGLELDLEWRSIMAPHEIRYRSASTMIGARHFDQPGRLTGSIVLDGERVPVDGFSLRDRSWGPHRPGAARSGDYLWAIADEREHWHAITAARSSEHPGLDEVVNGYLVRDGELGELVTGERRVVERRAGAPVRVELDAEDEHGRALHARGEVRSVLRWLGWPGRLTFWTLTDWRWDGHQGWGEDQEFFPRDLAGAVIRAT